MDCHEHNVQAHLCVPHDNLIQNHTISIEIYHPTEYFLAFRKSNSTHVVFTMEQCIKIQRKDLLDVKVKYITIVTIVKSIEKLMEICPR